MSTMKIVALIGVCLLLGGCAPITGVKSVAALVFSLVAAAGAWFGFLHNNHEHAVCEKARALDEAITNHEAKYRPMESAVVELSPSHKGNGIARTQMRNGIAAPDMVTRLNERV